MRLHLPPNSPVYSVVQKLKWVLVGLAFLILTVTFLSYIYILQNHISEIEANQKTTQRELTKTSMLLEQLENEDQVVKNKKLQEEIGNIKKSYKNAVSLYEKLTDLKALSKKDSSEFDKLFAQTLSQLSDENYASAEATLAELQKKIESQISVAVAPSSPSTASVQNVPTNNTPPGSGYARQSVSTEIGSFVVDIISADLNSTKVIVDTASDGDCANDCPVLSLADYVARNGAYAGINGSYFCPASYPSCAGKTNSFDTLLMNKNKKYFNSDNNVYSTVPVAVFGQGWARFMGRSLDWGRDTSVDAVIANQGLLLSGGNITFGGDGDPKKGSKGSRSFIGNKGSTVYIGVVYNATVAEVAYALKALGLENALNLDSGGSTALWSGGYKAGPGRNIPNAVLFIRR